MDEDWYEVSRDIGDFGRLHNKLSHLTYAELEKHEEYRRYVTLRERLCNLEITGADLLEIAMFYDQMITAEDIEKSDLYDVLKKEHEKLKDEHEKLKENYQGLQMSLERALGPFKDLIRLAEE
jgi:hypothetical protein